LESIKIGSFDVLANLVILAFAYLGGISTVTGALYAGTLFASGIGVVVGEEFIALGRYESYVAGVALVATAVLNPQGIDGFDRAQRARLRRWWRTRVRQEASG
jgi:branched-chain amino acid transport system permease protein